ncbi:MAG TPA: TIM-barrel domain-containing protein [Bryobacteraceae bacterium]|nr:TIM-barrel domain-containing protein [Bryobacteraceae bacterium]
MRQPNRIPILAGAFALLAAIAVPAAHADVKVVTAAGRAALEFQFPGAAGKPDSIVLDRFLLDGKPIAAANGLAVKQLSGGVNEIAATSPSPGEWEFDLADQSSVYGFGERFDRLDHAHSIVRNASVDSESSKGGNTYQPIPFFMSLRGYGLWLDTFGEATFDINATEKYRIRIKAIARRLRVVLIEGPRFPLILDRFTALVGRQQLPPYWAFAPWKARDYHRNQAEVDEDVDRYRELGLPASVLLIDSPWATNYNTYEFNPKQFDDATKMIAHIHGEGYKLVLWHTPWIDNATSKPGEQGFADKIPPLATNFAEAEKNGYFLHRPDGATYIAKWWKGQGSLIDFTNPAAKKWWQGQVGKAIAAGADGFKDDDAEGNFVGDVKYSSNEDQRLVRNRYAVDYNHAVAEALTARKGKDWVLFQRSGTTGAHMQPFFWGGDNDATFSTENGLPTVITAGLNAGMSGISLWMTDLGGYNKSARYDGDNVLFARWTEYSALSPGMEVMSSMNLGPWDYGYEALRIFQMYSVLHMSLFPYRYAAAQESARNGLPMMRALVLMHQDDPEARVAETEYYFGPDLLVAPVLSPVSERAVYLPEGAWIDYWSGKPLAGRRTVVAAAPLDRIPLYVREGAILPRIPEDVMTLVPQAEVKDPKVKSLDDRRVYEIYPGQPLREIVDFEGRAVKPGADARSLEIAGKPARVTLRWRFGGPESAQCNGKKLEVQRTADGVVSVEFEHGDSSQIAWQ